MSGTAAQARERLGRGSRVAALVALTLLLLLAVARQPPIPQPPGYHDFADRRSLLGVPRFWDVASNLPFGVIGLLGCVWLLRQGRRSGALGNPGERAAYVVFFAGELLTCLASAYYHTAPANDRLVWDRLAFSLLPAAALAIVVSEFVSRRVGRALLVPMAALAVLSVLAWGWSEAAGRGDLRLYLVVQFYPAIVIPLILLLFRSRYTHAGAFWGVWGLFVAAKLAELGDRAIFSALGFWSGHTLKHFLAAGATCVLLRMLHRRRGLGTPVLTSS